MSPAPMSSSPKRKYQFLLEDADVRRWHDNVSRGSSVTADVYLRRLGFFCEIHGTSPKGLIDKEAQDSLTKQKELGRTVFLVCENGSVVGLVSVADVSRQGVAESVADMRSVGVKNVVMLTGDNSATAHAIANQVGINEVGADLLPEGKVDYVKKLKSNGNRILMVGDGINDAPALAAAHVGVAMGKTGTDVAIETADVVLISDDLSKVPQIINIGRKTVSLIKQNILIALAVNIVGIFLAASGDINPVIAAAIHEGNALFVVLN